MKRFLSLWALFWLTTLPFASVAEDTTSPLQRLVVLGDSIAAGYGVSVGEAWPDRLQEKIKSAHFPFTVVNAGLSGDTTAGGLRRIDWILRQPVHVLILELGGNDGLRGIPPATTQSNLVAITQKVRAKYPTATIILAGMQMPPSMGREFTESFARVFPEVAKSEDLHLIPHLFEGVGGVPELNLPDRIHPTAEGHRLITTTVWQTLEPVLSSRMTTNPK